MEKQHNQDTQDLYEPIMREIRKVNSNLDRIEGIMGDLLESMEKIKKQV